VARGARGGMRLECAKTRMLKENPKLVPREWMLVEAYEVNICTYVSVCIYLRPVRWIYVCVYMYVCIYTYIRL